jgi:hypothetical protein
MGQPTGSAAYKIAGSNPFSFLRKIKMMDQMYKFKYAVSYTPLYKVKNFILISDSEKLTI